MPIGILTDTDEKIIEQIEATMNVADDVHGLSVRNGSQTDVGDTPNQASNMLSRYPRGAGGATYFTRGTIRFNLAMPLSSGLALAGWRTVAVGTAAGSCSRRRRSEPALRWPAWAR